MAGDETIYTFGTRAPIWFAFGRDNSSALPVTRAGVVVEPTAATYSLVNIAGLVISSPAVVIGVDNIARVTVPAADLPATLGLGEGFSERWSLTLDGVVRTARRDLVLGRTEIHPPVAEFDLVSGEYPDLLADVAGFAESLQDWMDVAWNYCCRQLVRRGDFPDVIFEPSDIYDWYAQETFSRVFKALFKSQNNDRFHELWLYHRDKAQSEKDGLRVKRDADRDGLAESLARKSASQSVHVNLPPRRRTRSGKW